MLYLKYWCPVSGNIKNIVSWKKKFEHATRIFITQFVDRCFGCVWSSEFAISSKPCDLIIRLAEVCCNYGLNSLKYC